MIVRLLVTILFALSSAPCAQDRGADNISSDLPAQPAITFTLDFPQSVPSHYSLKVMKDGHASYESMGKLTPEAEGDPFSYAFTMSRGNVARIFDLAVRANYFAGDVDYRKGRQANTGKKMLAYVDVSRHHATEYNYSTRADIQQLTRLLQSIAITVEFARQLQYFHRYQPLALEQDLKRMEEMAKGNDLQELPSIAPVLRQIADDKSILNVTRARALRLLSSP